MRQKYHSALAAYAVLGVFVVSASGVLAQPIPSPPPIMPPSLPPTHIVDLMTVPGATALGAKWKVMEAKLVEVPAAPNAMPEYKTTHNIMPRANEVEFDDSSWPVIGADTLGARRGGGHVSFLWYRTTLTIPGKIGEFDPTGAVVVLTALAIATVAQASVAGRKYEHFAVRLNGRLSRFGRSSHELHFAGAPADHV
jgi:hypothetical protein